ncbi:Panacea domain-containing protein [Lachnoclostridium sp.]|uniref:Panacea domain-containing protein n=1 Tax=Lachnoclostridium sp. TaxID=2028282 RepID=UPI00289D2172|nr:type II toxin-antitoxin system antitoxin SocA domain-containing protein [Lachnoclostridium sp.]
MNDVFKLAEAFLSIESMTAKKLQKLCYYAKAWYLALYDEDLIREDFEAWVHGPVCPKLYSKYRGYGYNMIPKISVANNIPEEFLNFANKVFYTYGDLDGDELEELTHSEDPWINAREGLRPWEGGNEIISKEDMKSYYRQMADE